MTNEPWWIIEAAGRAGRDWLASVAGVSPSNTVDEVGSKSVTVLQLTASPFN